MKKFGVCLGVITICGGFVFAEGKTPAELIDEYSNWVQAHSISWSEAAAGSNDCEHFPLPEWFKFTVVEQDEAQDGQTAQTQPAGYSYWRTGPSEPGNFWGSFKTDVKEFAPMVWGDTKSVITNKYSLAGLILAGISGALLIDQKPDHRVEEHFAKHGSQLNTEWDSFGSVAGAPHVHFAIAGSMYLLSHYNNDDRTYQTSKKLFSALAINGLTTVALKAALRTESPNGDENGWPSGHTSSSFCFATVMYHEYGPWVGVPMFALASFVGYERIDARNHDFSDVVAGALIGMAIGHAVSMNHEAKLFGMDVVPNIDPARNSFGIALMRQW